MAATATTTKRPLTAKTLIFDPASYSLNVHASQPVPTPDPTKNDHLVHVKTTALCAGELTWPALFPVAIYAENPDKKITPGYDLAGTVVTAPPASPFRPGDEVYARTFPSRPGNCREYTIARTEEMALKPQKLSRVEAATVPLSALTAWQGLFEHAGMKGFDDPDKKKVLVLAAAGLEVVAQVGSAKNDEFVRRLGASNTVNYKTTSLKEWAEMDGPADIVFDLVGGETLEDAWYCVKDGATLIGIVEPPEGRRPEELREKVVKNEFFIMTPNGLQLAEISGLLEGGRCEAVVDSVWALEDYEGAFDKLNGGHANGKVVIKVAEKEE